ncbi:aspartyl/asparaginyl beta-hydroxylase domain-containing protein [Streptomyces sp. NPDC001904]|uniref:aspartyl/asparaginyl beta-hydroxylase domain-containing protein n=1 Tax=Streptomyces sp. NPDC001904 TaxID=3154531 RepID=UPI003319DD44
MKTSPYLNSPRLRTLANWIFLRKSGGANRRRIIPSDAVFPEVWELERKFPELKAEVDALLKSRSIPTYDTFDPQRASEVSDEWRLYYAYMFGKTNQLAKKDLPTLLSFAQSTPNVVNAFVSILEPGVTLPSHQDPYAGILRYHLGIQVPTDNPPRIRLADEFYQWKEGEGTVLDVSLEHEVVNESAQARVIVIIDFRRPMGPLASALNRYLLWQKRKFAPQFVEAAKYDVMH